MLTVSAPEKCCVTFYDITNCNLAWAETPATSTVSADVEADPWGSSSEAAADKDAGDQDGWANFCAFTSPSEEAAEGIEMLPGSHFSRHNS